MFERSGGWAWVQAERDGYVGYVAEEALSEAAAEPTHRVTALATFVYPEPELKTPPLHALSIGSQVRVVAEEVRRDNRYLLQADGTAIFAGHLAQFGEDAAEWVSIAEMFLNTPYQWGGTSAFGIDCSGLIQLPMYMAGRRVLRDTYMQETSVGEALETGGDFSRLRRGDLVFWKGHVGIMTDGETLLHANGVTMSVAREPLAEAVSRIEPLWGMPTSVRRP